MNQSFAVAILIVFYSLTIAIIAGNMLFALFRRDQYIERLERKGIIKMFPAETQLKLTLILSPFTIAFFLFQIIRVIIMSGK